MNTHVVIMAGGVGSRLWPMSTSQFPKQFVDVLGVGKSLIQLTVDRFESICPIENVWVVTGVNYVEKVKEQLPQISDDHIIAEPAARNTAPCIAYASWKIRQRHPDANIVVTPSDALVLDVPLFQSIVKEAVSFIEKGDNIVTLGVCPTRPETGYGYIAVNEQPVSGRICKVESFKEKPDKERAEYYISQKNYFWNAGIFVWNVNTIVDSIRTFVPGIAEIMDEMSRSFYTEDEKRVAEQLFPQCEKISIDYAVMERSQNIFCLPALTGWSDVGTWGSFHSLMEKDDRGNVVLGDNVKLYDCDNSIIHALDAESVVVQGLSNCVVTFHDGKLLVCSLSHDQDITKYI